MRACSYLFSIRLFIGADIDPFQFCLQRIKLKYFLLSRLASSHFSIIEFPTPVFSQNATTGLHKSVLATCQAICCGSTFSFYATQFAMQVIEEEVLGPTAGSLLIVRFYAVHFKSFL